MAWGGTALSAAKGVSGFARPSKTRPSRTQGVPPEIRRLMDVSITGTLGMIKLPVRISSNDVAGDMARCPGHTGEPSPGRFALEKTPTLCSLGRQKMSITVQWHDPCEGAGGEADADVGSLSMPQRSPLDGGIRRAALRS